MYPFCEIPVTKNVRITFDRSKENVFDVFLLKVSLPLSL